MQRCLQQSDLPDAVATCAFPSSETGSAQSAEDSSVYAERASSRHSAQRSALPSARSVSAADAPPECGLEATELAFSAVTALERVIRSMDPQWSRLSVAARAKRGPRSYVINVHGQGSIIA